jgi:hypothetical protein
MKNMQLKGLIIISIFLIIPIGFSLYPIDNNMGITENIEEGLNEEDPSALINTLKSSGVSDWWNASYRYRVEITIQEPGFINRTNEPVDVSLSFDSNKCHKDTIKVMAYKSGDVWIETVYQLWNTTMYDSTYIESTTITFLATVEENDNALYYVYFSDNNDNGRILNPNQGYIDNSGFSSQLQGPTLSVTTTEFSLELEEGRGVYNFTKGNQNFHTNYSLAPWIKNGQIDHTVYHPGTYGGDIHDWLVVGTFNFFNPNWDNVVTETSHHFDISKDYIEGDNATGGDAPPSFLDESKQWEYFDFSTLSRYNSYHGYMDFNTYFPGDPNHVCAYASAYIRSPIDLNDVYLRVGSDDGIKVIRDGEVIHYNHVLRGPYPDREYIQVSFEAGKWYYFIVLVEENGGGAGFHFRFSNNTNSYEWNVENDAGAITNLDIMLNPPLPVIQSISEVENGPVFSQYDITWEDSEDMKIFDRITIFNDYNLWRSERTLWWADEQVNTSFSMLNTLYDNTNDVFDDYFYDTTWTESGMNNPTFTAENYSVIWDSSASKNLMSLGVYITKIEKGNAFIELNLFKWASNYDSSEKIVNFKPGNQTDLDNKGSHIWPGDSDYNIKFTFWEFLDDNIGSTPNNYQDANESIAGIYNSLKNPLIETKDGEESSFFDLMVNVTDHDGLQVEEVKVYLYNSTLDAISNQFTDIKGSTLFQRLPKDNYTLNFTFSDSFGEFNVRTNYQVNLNETKSILVDNLNLTSLNLNLEQLISPYDPIQGADVEFWYKNSTGDLEYRINTIESLSDGSVLFVWKNISQSEANISVRVFLLGQYRLINNSITSLSNSLNYTFYSRRTDNISVQIDPYTTGIDLIDPTTTPVNDKYKGEDIDITIRYWYESGSIVTNISDAIVSYNIKNTMTGLVVLSGIFNDDIIPVGFYNYSLDTNSASLVAGIPYQMIITADKSGYTLQSISVSFTLKEIWTNLTSVVNDITVSWDENLNFRVYYNDTIHGIGLDGSTISYSILGKTSGSFTEDLLNVGWYDLVLNTAAFTSVGSYVMSVTAIKQNYRFQEIFININITQISTELTPNISIIENTWNEDFSISVLFNDTVNQELIIDAIISYSVLGTINPVEGNFINLGNGIYELILNSTELGFTGSYFLRITASRINYEIQSIDIPLNIYPISTLINNTVGIYASIEVIVGTSKNFYFNYTVASNGLGLLNSLTRTCEWDKKDENGTVVDTGVLTLTNIYEGIYELDFDTEMLEIATYSFAISIGKTNYAQRTAILILKIIPKLFHINLTDSKFSGNIISVVSGNSLAFTIEIKDFYANTLLIGTEVYLTFQGTQYNFTDNNDGTYSVSITNLPDAFFTSQQISAIITTKGANFTDGEQNIFIVVTMTEIFPGFPMFYFIMIVGALIAVVGSLIAYRTIQQARIPTFVKKVRDMKSTIKSRKSISEALLYPSKESVMVKQFGDRWEMLGLSLEEILGVDTKKRKELPERTEIKGGAE